LPYCEVQNFFEFFFRILINFRHEKYFFEFAGFVVMSLLHAQFTEWTVRFLSLPGGDFGMYSYFILIFCSVITAIGLLTVIIFRKSYHSIFRIAILFEAIYLLFLIISGNNPLPILPIRVMKIF
jgi:hypothetical protein